VVSVVVAASGFASSAGGLSFVSPI
jgi:hypothetical protein